jgi:hypothetical protein
MNNDPGSGLWVVGCGNLNTDLFTKRATREDPQPTTHNSQPESSIPEALT